MLAWLQLVRLPTVFTALADTIMAIVVAGGAGLLPAQFGLLLATTVCLYWAGMIFNDYCDREVDANERPSRPIPSGRIPASIARNVTVALFVVGFGGACAASYLIGNAWPAAIASVLVASIVAYDSWLKHTPLGPWAMGLCRALNVLMIMTAAGTFASWQDVPWLIPLGLLGYIAGVTLFARDEAGQPSRSRLMLAAAVALLGLLFIALSRPDRTVESSFVLTDWGWALVWVVVALFVARRFVAAIVQPQPTKVIAAVKYGLLSLILIDAALVLSAGGPFWMCAILALLAPAYLLGQWIPMT